MQIRIVEFPSRSILISVLHFSCSVYTSNEKTTTMNPEVSYVKIKEKSEKYSLHPVTQSFEYDAKAEANDRGSIPCREDTANTCHDVP